MDGSGVLRTKFSSSLVSENCPGQDMFGPEDGYAVGQESYLCTYRIRQAGMYWNWKIAAVEVGGGRDRMQ